MRRCEGDVERTARESAEAEIRAALPGLRLPVWRACWWLADAVLRPLAEWLDVASARLWM